ncbi:hypothetical protein MHU86_10671 [Fragilaria crotonensis]|nr:hypothetical protein MHU86_10671 [Fragilaria crotonensis]
MSFEDCSICLDAMQQTDFDHPLQCEIHCGYNFCKNCIESFITSSMDEYMEASDGNRHVKVSLHCPNCRSDLSHTIRDTLLLRKADELLKIYESYNKDDTKLTAKQLQLKEALRQPKVQAAIACARQSEAEYLGREYNAVESPTLSPSQRSLKSSQNKLDVDYEEWGVEMDLESGVHKSFREPRSPSPRVRRELPKTKVDTSLFPGLDYFLTDDERFLVTDLLTRGEPDLLSEAAQILRSVALGSRNAPAVKPLVVDDDSKRPDNPKRLTKLSSVFELIADSEKAHLDRHVKEFQKISGKPAIQTYTRPAVVRATQHRALERDLKRQAHFKKLFPIPVRMPKSIEIDLGGTLDMLFVDGEWNGTVMDAYSKLSISYTGKVTQKKPQNPSVYTVLGENGTSGDIQIELPGQPRVLIRDAGRDAGHQGAVRGDVVTHLNGESVGTMTSGMILDFIAAAKLRGERTLTVTLNAERSVAEALKRRAIAVAALW